MHAILHYLGCHFCEQWFGKGIAETVIFAIQGKTDVGDENGSEYVIDNSPDVDEEELIE